jgi:hypothetical protein
MNYDGLLNVVSSKAHRLLDEASHRQAAEDKRRKVLEGSVVVPNLDAQDKLIRYAAHYERQFAKTLSQLETLQRLRAGEDVAPPLRIHVDDS